MRRNGMHIASAALSMVDLGVANGGVAHAAPAEPEPTGIVTITKADGGVAGWVSNDALTTRFNELPGAVQEMLGSTRSDIAPRSADGCSVEVCINVVGEDLLVYKWETTAYGNVGCQEAYFHYPNGNYVGPYICPDEPGDGVYYDTTGPTGYFPDQSQLCNTWGISSGRPCITVHD